MIRFFLFLFISLVFVRGEVIPAANQPNLYLPYLKNKNIALAVNQSSVVGEKHLVDFLFANKIKIVKIFAPEHGFRGEADAGAHVKNSRDIKTNLPIISLYGNQKKPSAKDLRDVELLLFDIQDVGVRFYTYLTTLHNIMESAGKHNIPLIILDRPNPNGHYIDGPILKRSYASFVGIDPVPLVYGMTIGEYAKMLQGEGWIENAKNLKMKVIPIANYNHNTPYHLTIKPSPNLPNDLSIALYPSLGLFEGTTFNEGRGTDKQFQLYGDPLYEQKNFSYTPIPKEGAKNPKHLGKKCYGQNLSSLQLHSIRNQKGIILDFILDAYKNYPNKNSFFLKNGFFDKLAGDNTLRQEILNNKTAHQIRSGWQNDLEKFKSIRKKYLIYP